GWQLWEEGLSEANAAASASASSNRRAGAAGGRGAGTVLTFSDCRCAGSLPHQGQVVAVQLTGPGPQPGPRGGHVPQQSGARLPGEPSVLVPAGQSHLTGVDPQTEPVALEDGLLAGPAQGQRHGMQASPG